LLTGFTNLPVRDFHPLDKFHPALILISEIKFVFYEFIQSFQTGVLAHARHTHAVIKHCADSAIFERNNI
jgi:hypothetical protein